MAGNNLTRTIRESHLCICKSMNCNFVYFTFALRIETDTGPRLTPVQYKWKAWPRSITGKRPNHFIICHLLCCITWHRNNYGSLISKFRDCFVPRNGAWRATWATALNFPLICTSISPHPHIRKSTHPHIHNLISRRKSPTCYACIQNVPNTVLNFGLFY